MSENPPLVSVVICTYDRAEILKASIQSACDQNFPVGNYEIIIVDNNSTDHTHSVVQQMQNDHPNIHYCTESVQGLSAARNRGYREAAGQYVAYLDDDAKAPVEWLSTAKGIIDQRDPDVFGGPYYPYYRTAKPRWFLDKFGAYEMADGPQFYKSRDQYLSGGNFFIRRELLFRMNGFSEGLGMTGGSAAYGEETDLLNRLYLEMPEVKVYYDPALYILHLVRAQKMTLKWRVRELFHRGFYSLKTHNIYAERGPIFILRYLMVNIGYLAFYLTVGVLRRDRAEYPYARSFLYGIGLKPIAGIGRVVGWFQLRGGESRK